jgi:hypothetical protein
MLNHKQIENLIEALTEIVGQQYHTAATRLAAAELLVKLALCGR